MHLKMYEMPKAPARMQSTSSRAAKFLRHLIGFFSFLYFLLLMNWIFGRDEEGSLSSQALTAALLLAH